MLRSRQYRSLRGSESSISRDFRQGGSVQLATTGIETTSHVADACRVIVEYLCAEAV